MQTILRLDNVIVTAFSVGPISASRNWGRRHKAVLDFRQGVDPSVVNRAVLATCVWMQRLTANGIRQ